MPKHTVPTPVAGVPVLLDRRQASAAIGCSEQALRKYIADGRIREVEIGGLHRIPASEIDRMIAEQLNSTANAKRTSKARTTTGRATVCAGRE